MTRACTGADGIFEVLDTGPEAYADPAAVPTTCTPGRIDFRRVTFGYDKARPVLRDLSFSVLPGEMVGIVGRSGVGKTTIVNLLCRFYHAAPGRIGTDAVDIPPLRPDALRTHTATVPPD